MNRIASQGSKASVEAIENVDASDKKKSQYVVSETSSAEERKLVRKIDLYLMPSIWLLYLFSYMDRTNIGNAKVAGMMEDLKLTSNEYSLAIIVFIISYVVFEVPSNLILSRSRPSLYIPGIMFVWGAIGAAMAAVRTPGQLLAVRFLMGVAEAGFSPAVLFIISTWYRKSEQSKRFMVFLSAGILSGAFAGLLAGAIASGLDGAHGIPGWRWLFIVEGVLTCGVACIAPFVLLDYPSTARQFTPAQRQLAVMRLHESGVSNYGEGERSISRKRALMHVCTDIRVYLLCLAYQTVVGVLGSLSYFVPTLVKGLGYTSTVSAQLMSAPVYVVAFAVAVPTAILADRFHPYRPIIIVIVLALGTLFCALSAGIYAHVPRYVFLCFITTATWTANPLALSYASSALGSVQPEFRAITLAAINGSGNLATIYASYLFPAEDAPKYLKGFGTYAAIMFFGAFLYLVAFVWLRRRPFEARA